jgi:cysteinyl-tRNA synthetase
MQGPPLTLYNSLGRGLQRFEPIDPANVRVYSCGPTVYNYAHIGNLRAYVFTDTLARVLTWKGWPLTHVINITDVGHLTSDADAGDDKMEAAAKASGRDIWAIAAHYTQAFKQNLSDLNIREPTRFPLATDHVAEMIEFARTIERHCYRLEDGLYFDTATVPDYGRLAGVGGEQEGRIDAVAGKRHPQDFAIWRTSAPGENRQMEWDSPWGRGAPGWHLECSVMSRQYLGERFDIHTGGIDHREIHHPNEIAQNQAMHGCEPGYTGANWWMHNNFVVERTGKMSKSSGGFKTLQTLVDRGFHPLSYRLMCLQAHYRSEMEFSWEGLAAAQTRLKRIVKAVEAFREGAGDPEADDETVLGGRIQIADTTNAGLLRRLDEAISADLNTALALVLLQEALDRQASVRETREIIQSFDDVLGLDLSNLTRKALRVAPKEATIAPDQVDAKLAERQDARRVRDFTRSDAIRDELAAAGVEVMDGDPLGWDWKTGA